MTFSEHIKEVFKNDVKVATNPSYPITHYSKLMEVFSSLEEAEEYKKNQINEKGKENAYYLNNWNITDELPIAGADSMEHAYYVENYPYGFRLRTTARYWIESVKKRGDRVCFQTKNPKTGQWNKPKKGTYNAVTVLYLDMADNHVKSRGISQGWSKENEVNTFLNWARSCKGDAFPFNNLQLEQLRICRAISRTQEYITVSIKPQSLNQTPEEIKEEERKKKETTENIHKLFSINMYQVKKETGFFRENGKV